VYNIKKGLNVYAILYSYSLRSCLFRYSCCLFLALTHRHCVVPKIILLAFR